MDIHNENEVRSVSLEWTYRRLLWLLSVKERRY